MASVELQYIGGIESLDGPSLTGSATLVRCSDFSGKSYTFLVDYGMFQGGRSDSHLNKEVFLGVEHIDYVIVTHAHTDHIGRLPLLIKNGFKGKIIMTSLTKQITQEMLLDYVRVVEAEIQKVEEINTKNGKRLQKALQYKELYEKLKENGLKKGEKSNIERKLQTLSDGDFFSVVYKRNLELLKELGVSVNADIANCMYEIPELLFDEDHVYETMRFVRVLEFGDKISLNNTIFIKSLDEEIILDIVKKIKNGYTKTIYTLPGLKSTIISHLKSKLEQQKLEVQRLRKERKSNRDNHETIDQQLPYTLDDIEKLSRLLQESFTEYNQKLIESIDLEFLEAGHIEGSAQALISLVTQETVRGVTTVLKGETGFKGMSQTSKHHYNMLFTGDLGRIGDPNLSGSPQISDLKLDYLQIESTYAGKNHRERQEGLDELFSTIQKAPGKILIPAFSLQRTQEVLMILLEKMKLSRELIIPQMQDAKKYLRRKKASLEKLGDARKFPLTGLTKLEKRVRDLQKSIRIYEKKLSDLEAELFDFPIVLDSTLSSTITDIFLRNLGEKYKLLNPTTQKDIFGKILVEVLKGPQDFKKLYSSDRVGKKEIVISAAGMCEGGGIVSHLQQNLSNSKSSIVFVGYCPPTTRGGKIKAGEIISIDGSEFEVKCRVHDIGGFSGHIDEKGILEYIQSSKFSRGATITLTHGNEARNALAEEIRGIKRKVSVTVPQLGERSKFSF